MHRSDGARGADRRVVTYEDVYTERDVEIVSTRIGAGNVEAARCKDDTDRYPESTV